MRDKKRTATVTRGPVTGVAAGNPDAQECIDVHESTSITRYRNRLWHISGFRNIYIIAGLRLSLARRGAA